MTKDMVDHVISVLVIEDGSSPGRVACRMHAADEPKERGATDRPHLSFIYVQRLEDVVEHLRNGGIDALLVDRWDFTDMTRLQASADHLPILVVAETDNIEIAQNAINAGAEDALLPTDLEDENALSRRILLAIARKTSEMQQRRRAREDAPTGLANDILIEERFIRALARANRYATLVGLVAINLDGFDALTTRYGQSIVDHLLPAVGQRLLSEIRQTDTLARTRHHGFTWLVEGLSAIDDIDALVNRLPNRLAHPFSIHGQEIHVTVSAGVAISPFHGRDFQTVNGMAEAAMIDVSSISGDALLMLPIPRTSKTTRTAALT